MKERIKTVGTYKTFEDQTIHRPKSIAALSRRGGIGQ